MSGKSVWEIFVDECPKVAEAYMNLSKEININSSLDEKTRNLILIGIYSTTRDPIALKHFIRMALRTGASKDEIQTAALLAFNVGVSSAELSIPLILETVQEQN